MSDKKLLTSLVLLFLSFVLFSFFSSVIASESSDFILTEDTFSSVENSASTSEIISESILIPIQRIGETTGNITERSHELSVCGNGVQEFQEICDGGDFNGKTCNDFGFNSGILACSSHCSSFVTSGCNNSGGGIASTSTPSPSPLVTPIISTGGPSTLGGGGNNGSGSGGKDPLLLLTPTPSPSPETSFHPVATEKPQKILPTLVPSATPHYINPYTSYTDEYEGDPRETSSPRSSPLISIEKSKKEEKEHLLHKKITPYEWLSIEPSKKPLDDIYKEEKINPDSYADFTPLVSDILDEENKGSLFDFEKGSKEINQNNNIHASSQLQDTNISRGFGCGKYYFIILFITFLLGMLTEYILSSILLTQKK